MPRTAPAAPAPAALAAPALGPATLVLGTLALAAFVVFSAAHMTSLVTGPAWLEWSTKAVLMPPLAAWVWWRRGPFSIVMALVLSCAGDIALQINAGAGVFVLGMAFFAAAHACYLRFFVPLAAVAPHRRRWSAAAAYGVVWIVVITLLWPGLGDLRLPATGYSLLLAATAATTAACGLRAGLGGALFLLSDTMIAAGLADLPRPQPATLWVMATYVLAQYLLASATLTARPGATGGPAQ